VSPATRRFSILALLALLAAFAPAARQALAASYVVTSFADSGPGTLREAITNANASPGPDTITFSAAGTINVVTPLPALSGGGITIDGSVPAGGAVPKVEIRGNGTVAGQGILITSSNNIVRGLIVSGFRNAGTLDYRGAGIVITGYGVATAPSGNLIERNYLGTDASGNAAGPGGTFNNASAGLIIEFGASGTIARNNVISGNATWGVFVYGDPTFATKQQNNVITNNFIGTNPAGTQAVPNRAHGVYVSNNSIGTVVGPGNVISGNGSGKSQALYGVYVLGQQSGGYISGTRVIGNKIGTDVTGAVAIPNTGQIGVGSAGVGVGQSTGTQIGGPAAGDGNLISGNQEYGVSVFDRTLGATVGTSNISIQNNKIGVAQDGVTPLANSQGGVLVWSKASGVTVGPGNVISGNAFYGVRILGVRNQPDATRQTRNITVSGNKIGADASGAEAIPNGNYGVSISGNTSGDTIAGNTIANNPFVGVLLAPDTSTPPASPSGNTISTNQIVANGPAGVQLLGASINNVIGPGNTITDHDSAGIELQSSGNTVKGNTIGPRNQIGINITNGAANNLIGGATLADGNRLTGNLLHGVFVTGTGSVGNRISRTTTEANGGKGIALANGGNLAGGAGRPFLSNLAVNGTTLSGSVTNGASCGGNGCTIQVFTDENPPVDEGPEFLTQFVSAGSFNNVALAGCKPYLIFTVTDAAGNTSEFANQIGPRAQCVPAAPAVTITTAPPPPPRGVLPGGSTTYVHTVRNSGSGAGPVSVNFVSNNPWAALANNTCTGTLAPNATCTFSVVVNVPANATAGQFNQATITVNIGSASAQQSDRTNVLVNPGLSFTPPTQTKSAGPGQPVSYAHTLANQGNGPDAFAITVTPPSPQWAYIITPASTIGLAQGGTSPVTVTLTPPAGVAPGTYTTTVRAASTNDPTVFKTVTDVTTIAGAAVPRITGVVAPASVNPGGTTTINYTIENAGNQAGTFNLAFVAPSGWTVTDPVTPSVTLAPNATAVTSATLQAPAGALAGPYVARLTATATDANGAQATAANVITVNKRAGWTLTPANTTTPERAPGAVYSDTLTLTNNGNFTDTVALAATSSAGWGVRPIPAQITLNPGASADIDVELTIPPGLAAGADNTTTVTATSSLAGPPVRATALITTEVAVAPGATFLPDFLDKSVLAGQPMTFTFTLQNSGSISQSYALSTDGVPVGWTSELTPTDTPQLAPGQSLSVRLVLRPPANVPTGTITDVTIEAVSDQAPFPTAEATARLRIGPSFNAGLDGQCDVEALPGDRVVCAHTVTNTGLSSETFAIVTTSPLGWEAAASPASVLLAPGASATVSVTLQVPSSADAGIVHELTVAVRSTATGQTQAAVVDTTTVKHFAGVSISPSQLRPPLIGGVVVFQHVLLNTGNAPDSFVISATQQLDWPITIVPTRTATLARGASYPVEIRVQVPSGRPEAPINRIHVTATSVSDPSVSADLFNFITFEGRGPDTLVFMPMMRRP
jgi:uncharacterized membrane protein